MIARYSNLQVDLFKNATCRTNYFKVARQIEKRNFKLVQSLDSIDDIVECPDRERTIAYKEYLCDLAKKTRNYQHIGTIGCDNLYDLEALGVGAYSMPYTVVLDFSNALDYFLHLTYGCKIVDIRRIPDYNNVSSAILNYDFSKTVGITFGVLFDISEELNTKLAKMLTDADPHCHNLEEKRNWVVYHFYLELLTTISQVKDYVVSYLNHTLKDKKFIYRSKSYSSSIATSGEPFTEEIILQQRGFDNYVLQPRSYKVLEYARERVFTYVAFR